MAEINPGDVVRVTTDPPFKDADGVDTDPGEVRLEWRRRGSPPTVWVFGIDAEVQKDGTGVYHADIEVPRAGTFYYRWVGSEGLAAVEEGSFEAVSKF